MAGFGAYQFRPVFQQLSARLRRPRALADAAPSAASEQATPFKPRGRTYYSDETTTVIGRTLVSPHGMFRIADLASFRAVPVIEPRERARDAIRLGVFAAGMLAIAGTAAFGTATMMAGAYGAGTPRASLGTVAVCAAILLALGCVVLARWLDIYIRDPQRYRHVIVAVHRGESVAITPDLPYEAAGRVVKVLDKLKRRIPKPKSEPRPHVAA